MFLRLVLIKYGYIYLTCSSKELQDESAGGGCSTRGNVMRDGSLICLISQDFPNWMWL